MVLCRAESSTSFAGFPLSEWRPSRRKHISTIRVSPAGESPSFTARMGGISCYCAGRLFMRHAAPRNIPNGDTGEVAPFPLSAAFKRLNPTSFCRETPVNH